MPRTVVKKRKIRISITIPEDMLKIIDKIAEKKGLARSVIIQLALEEWLKINKNIVLGD
ncbi:MAG: ribbon-helix-helix domain-containing protein [Candidatus Njordarchaeales archaeon]